MPERNLRVMLASEYPEVRDLLSELAGRERGAVVVGQAENGIKATALARSLRPDVAMLDCRLPHIVGLDAVPLSRMGGLDAALTISQDVPATRVIVVGNLDAEVYGEQGLTPTLEVCLSREAAGATVPFMLQEVLPETLRPSAVVFANVETFASAEAFADAEAFDNVEAREQKSVRQRVAENSDAGILFGGLAIFGGLLLIGTMVLAIPGAIVALAGAGVVSLGIAGRIAAALWLRVSLATEEPGAEREQKGQGR